MADKKQLFEAGDLVQLKSGGAVMTIESFETALGREENSLAKCVWHEKSKHNSQTYPITVLMHYKNDPLNMLPTVH